MAGRPSRPLPDPMCIPKSSESPLPNSPEPPKVRKFLKQGICLKSCRESCCNLETLGITTPQLLAVNIPYKRSYIEGTRFAIKGLGLFVRGKGYTLKGVG